MVIIVHKGPGQIRKNFLDRSLEWDPGGSQTNNVHNILVFLITQDLLRVMLRQNRPGRVELLRNRERFVSEYPSSKTDILRSKNVGYVQPIEKQKGWIVANRR